VKTAGLISLVIIPLLFACLPKKPEITLPEAPAGPLLAALEQRRAAFSALKAVASVEAVRSGRRRAYDTVGIMIDGQRRLRMEAYSPLGQSLVTLVWNGADMLLRLEDGRVLRPDPQGLERILGVALDAGELCAALSANLPLSAGAGEAKAYREPDGGYLIEFHEGELVRHVFLPLQEGPGQDVRIDGEELFRSGKLQYRVRYEEMERISGYLVPKTVRFENPEKKASLTIEYHDTDVNAPLQDDAFTLPAGEDRAP